MESTLEGPATLEALLAEYEDTPPRHPRKSPPAFCQLQTEKLPPDFNAETLMGIEQTMEEEVTGGEQGSSRLVSEDDHDLISRSPAVEVGSEDGVMPGGGAVPMVTGEERLDVLSPEIDGLEDDASYTGGVMSRSESQVFSDGEPIFGDGSSEGNAEQEEEEQETEMTKEEKKAMSDAVCDGNIDLLDDLLDLPGADINMEWFGENLLMAAIRNDEPEMAAFLLDNGIDQNYEASRLNLKNPATGEMEWYTISCRQMAYECGMMDVVDIIDELNNNSWPFIRSPPRTPRTKRPLADKLREKNEAAEAERKRRQQMEHLYRRRTSTQEATSEDARDNASITSRTSYNSSFAFSDVTSTRGDRKRKQSKSGQQTDAERSLSIDGGSRAERAKTADGTPLAEGEEGEEEEEEEETGPFFVPLGPTHMFPYPAEEAPPPEPNYHHYYRSNRTFMSRRDSNNQKFRSSMSVGGSGAGTPVDRSPSVGSYRTESLFWAPTVTSLQEPIQASQVRQNGRHTSLATRLMSPWKDDDPSIVAAFHKRSKSACTAGNSSWSMPRSTGRLKSSKPLFPQLNTLSQLTGQQPPSGTPRRDNFVTPGRVSTGAARSILSDARHGTTPRSTHNMLFQQERRRDVCQSRADDINLLHDGEEGRAGKEPSTALPYTSMTLYKDTPVAELEGDSCVPSGRSRPPRSHSPAGYLRAFSAGRRQPAPVITLVPPT